MSLIRHDDPCVLFTMRRESTAFLQEFRPQQRIQAAPCWASFCGPADRSVLVLETGIGKENLLRALDWVLEQPRIGNVAYQPRFIVLAGFAGALAQGVRVGDVICADEVVGADGKRWRLSNRGSGDGERIATVDHILSTPEAKRQLALETGAMAVDMESAYAAARCDLERVPFACVRAISDDVDTALSPALTSLLIGGNVVVWRVLLALARHPSMLPELLRLAKDTKLAGKKLAEVLREMLVH